MTKKEQRIYDLLFAQEVTLKNLIDNIYLDNYKHIEIYKKNLLICVDLTCQVNDSKGHIVMYTYDFSSISGLLMRIRQIGGEIVTYKTIYNRVKEYKKLTGNDWYEARKAIAKDAREKKS